MDANDARGQIHVQLQTGGDIYGLFRLVHTVPDGNCFFDSLTKHSYFQNRTASELRADVSKVIALFSSHNKLHSHTLLADNAMSKNPISFSVVSSHSRTDQF